MYRNYLVISLVFIFVAGGCATSGEHRKLTDRVQSLEKDIVRDREALRKEMAQDVARLKKVKAGLKTMLSQAEKTLRESGANLGLRVSRLEADLPKLRGTLESIEYRMKHLMGDMEVIKQLLVDRMDAVKLLLPRDLPKEADGMWAAAIRYEEQRRTLVARAIYQLFEASYPKDKRAPQARMAMAKIQESAGRLGAAIKLYGQLEKFYPKSPLVPKAILRIGELLVKQKRCKQARNVYDYLMGAYKKSAEAKEAREQVAKLKSMCK